MKTTMELALARIELNQNINPDSIHWEMFKNDCMEKEKEQIIDTFNYGYYCASSGTDTEFELKGSSYYNKTYKP